MNFPLLALKSIQVIFSHDQPEMDMLDYPDQIMNLVVLLSAFKCQGSITGIDTLFHKESNRVEALRINLEKFGVALSAEDRAYTSMLQSSHRQTK